MKATIFQVEKNEQIENERTVILSNQLKKLFEDPGYYLQYFRSNKNSNKIGNQETESMVAEIQQNSKTSARFKKENLAESFLSRESTFLIAELLDKSFELEAKIEEMKEYFEVFFKHVEDAKSLRNEFFQRGITHFESKENYKKIYLNMPKEQDPNCDSYSIKFTQREWNKVMDYNYTPLSKTLNNESIEAKVNDVRPPVFLTM